MATKPSHAWPAEFQYKQMNGTASTFACKIKVGHPDRNHKRHHVVGDKYSKVLSILR